VVIINIGAVCKRCHVWMQALKTETIPFLVGLLETGLEAVDNMAATKAQIVKALKAMQLSLKYGDQVNIFITFPLGWLE